MLDSVLNTPLKFFDEFLQNTKVKIYDKIQKKQRSSAKECKIFFKVNNEEQIMT